jgi:hypothetical protein
MTAQIASKIFQSNTPKGKIWETTESGEEEGECDADLTSFLVFGLCKTLAKAWHWCASAPHLTHSIMKSRMTLSYRKIDTHLISITSAIYRIFRISKRRKIEKVIDSYW